MIYILRLIATTTRQAQEIKKYSEYFLNVDPDQDDKATEIKLLSFKRPHMRAFHCSWFCFFTAFFIWFAIAPLLPEVKETLGLTKQQVWTSNICSVAGTIFLRFVNGPLCDKYGARIPVSYTCLHYQIIIFKTFTVIFIFTNFCTYPISYLTYAYT